MNFLMTLFLVVFLFFVFVNGKVYELFYRPLFHDLIQDLPIGARFASLIAFYNDTKECQQQLKTLNFHNDDNDLPDLQYFLMGRYEMSTLHSRIWHEVEEHMDMAKMLGVTKYIESKSSERCECPLLVFVPIDYANNMGDDYLANPDVSQVKIWDSSDTKFSSWKEWVWDLLKVDIKILTDKPFPFEVTLIPNHNNKIKSKSRSPTVFKIDPSQAHTIIQAYTGDTIFVSTNPQISQPNRRRRQTQAPTDVENPKYTVAPDTKRLFVTQLEHGTWGFDIGPRQRMTEDLVRRRHITTVMTHARNLIFPLVAPHHDPIGFKKLKMPEGLHERLMTFYRNYYDQRIAETWEEEGTQLNYIDVKSHMVSLDHHWEERDLIASEIMKPILSEWSGGEELEFTAFYGIREYSRGAVLRNHVDRTETHVYSAILQVSQTDIDSPWPLEVISFDGKRHLITLEPGEMVLYESHTLIHGRPHPFNGTMFSNAFCHFKPKTWPWTASMIWKHNTGKAALSKLHVSLHDLYR